MPLSTQSVTPGQLGGAYRQELSKLQASEAVAKLWARQPNLWKSDPVHTKGIAKRLGWLSVIDSMRKEAGTFADLPREMNAAGLRDIVLLGMGGASLAPEVFSLMFPGPSRRGRFLILDSTDPTSIFEVEQQVDLPRTLFIVASKSGKTIETLSQFFYFRQRVQQAGVRPPGDHFIAITDAGSYLDELAAEYGFRRTYRNPPDIGGGYSALSYFGLVPAALWSVDVASILDAAIEMRPACGPEAPAETNPALGLGTLLGAAANNGVDKLILLSTPKLMPLANWVEQLIAESTGKEGRGVVPVASEVPPPLAVLTKGCVTATMALEGDDDKALEATVADLKRIGAPVVEIHLASATQLGCEYFKWEAATALTGVVLGIDPFDEPNVQESKDNTARILDGFQSSGGISAGTPRVSESGIELYAEGWVRSAISTLHLADALRTFFAGRRRDDYVALLSYVARDAANAAELEALRGTLSEHLTLPVLLGYGPRYLHSIGQLCKGGPRTGMFLVITSEKAADVSIPGAKYSFGQLQMAQALGDLESLVRRNKPAIRLHLMQGAPAGFVELRRAAGQALAGLRSAAS